MTDAVEATSNLRLHAARASLTVAALLILIKGGTYLLSESAGVLSSLMDSMLDALSSTVTLVGVNRAMRPPSRSYRFGWGKAEPLAALAQAAFIVGTAVLLTVEVADRLVTPPVIHNPRTAIWSLIVSSGLVILLISFQKLVVARTGSVAIKADLRHYLGDVAVNLAVIAGLVLTIVTRAVIYDTLFALLVALFLLASAWSVARQSLRLLLDHEIGGEERQRIQDVVRAHPQAKGLHDLRTRDSGTAQFIELHLELDGGLTLNAAHDITDEIERTLRQAFPQAEVLIHQEPAGLDDQRLDQRIAEAARHDR